MNKKWVYYLGLILVSIIWGANFGVSRSAMETFDPILFSFLRFGLAVPFFFLILRIKEGSVGMPWRVVLQLALIGLVGITGLEIAVMYAIKYTTLANASLLNVAPWPIFAALFAPLFVKEKFTRRLAVGGVAAIIGVTFVILGGEEGLDLSSGHMTGNLLAFGASLVGALYNLSCMPLMKTYSSLRISTWFIFFGSLFMLPLTVGSWSKVDWSGLGTGDYMAIVYNVLVCTVIAFVLWNASMFRIGAARSNFFRYVVPATAVVAGLVFFDEGITIWQIVGTVCMAAGLVWISTEKKPPQSAVNN
ncbi:DMT family transporter [Cohnella abietis]|uniref:Membrane protein n=1 Tax=Cohnella abietis TaxID=2507935 RepID=A0A3T1D0K7_9BACL|nr:DMT family transporter [Cohnella abietis]BBI31642.1 membrane protein [Cohnella abietis]